MTVVPFKLLSFINDTTPLPARLYYVWSWFEDVITPILITRNVVKFWFTFRVGSVVFHLTTLLLFSFTTLIILPPEGKMSSTGSVTRMRFF